MNKVSAIHFNPKIAPHLQHNDRTNLHSPNIYQDRLHLNECDKSAKQSLIEINKLYREACKKLDGKRKTPKNRCFHEAIFEIDENTTMAQCKEMADKIAEITGFTPIQIAIHRDEGHFENGEFKMHHHAHAVFFTLDKNTGKQLARLEAGLTKQNLGRMQDHAAEIFKMQRGERGSQKKSYKSYRERKEAKEHEKQYKAQIKADTEKLLALEIQNANSIMSQAQAEREYNEKREFELNVKESQLIRDRNQLEAQQQIFKNKLESHENEFKSSKAYQTLTEHHKNELKGVFFGKNKIKERQETEIRFLETRIHEAKNEIKAEVSKENQVLKAQLAESAKEVKRLTNELISARSEIASLKDTLKSIKNAIAQALEQMPNLVKVAGIAKIANIFNLSKESQSPNIEQEKRLNQKSNSNSSYGR